jgi:acyl-CoA thioesterase FadM
MSSNEKIHSSDHMPMSLKTSENRLMQVELQIPVRAYDVDALGIVSNIVYVRWFEDLRTAFLEVYLPMREMFAAGYSPILAHTDIHYRRPTTLSDQPVGRVWVEELGRRVGDWGWRFVSMKVSIVTVPRKVFSSTPSASVRCLSRRNSHKRLKPPVARLVDPHYSEFALPY